MYGATARANTIRRAFPRSIPTPLNPCFHHHRRRRSPWCSFISRSHVHTPYLYGVVDANRFGDDVEYVHGINMLPFTPITEELLGRDFMEQEWPVLETAFNDPGLGAYL